MTERISDVAHELVRRVSEITAGSRNEATLRHEIEGILEWCCDALDIPWIPFQLELALSQANGGSTRFADVAHGAVIIEYEPPNSFGGHEGAKLRHAQDQARDYAILMQREEGRELSEYVLVAWDGSHISFGHFTDTEASWQPLSAFNQEAAIQLLQYLKQDGKPLVHPHLLSQLVGPESAIGSELIPKLFEAVRSACTSTSCITKTKLLFTEWHRLFGQVAGIQSEHLRGLLQRQGEAHKQPYSDDPAAYLFSLNTYIALVAKLVAALSLPNAAQDLTRPSVPVEKKIHVLESGKLFIDAGISNMLIGDFFSWYQDDAKWHLFATSVEKLIVSLRTINFDVARKDPNTTRDLFKGMYQDFVPRALRHALGEFYTPDWLAAHALDQMGWDPQSSLLDPTCGTGTFILEALRRRLAHNGRQLGDVSDLLSGLYGIDLNPLAVLAARASLVVFLAPYLRPEKPVRLPVFLADAINTASVDGSIYRHTIQTELGPITFAIPKVLVQDVRFYDVMMTIRELVDAGYDSTRLQTTVVRSFGLDYLRQDELEALLRSIDTLVSLHQQGWNSIWTAILADRFAAAAIPLVRYIAGNPPWVKWSHLPPEYADFIKDRCLQLGVFSQDRWVGGIESDISTVVTYEALDKWLAPDGKMAFFITGTVFSNESSQGFRRFHLQHRCLRAKVLAVEDFDAVAPFDGVSNHPTLLILQRDYATVYPVSYRVWKPPIVNGNVIRTFESAEEFRRMASVEELCAAPVPGTDAGPWLKGTKNQHKLWMKVFGPTEPHYRARKGITTDRNGIYFVQILREISPGSQVCYVQNDPAIGRSPEISQVQAYIETEHVFPLLRGRGVKAFSARPDPDYYVLVPQRGMHGDPDLPSTAPRTYRFLENFKDELEKRSSYRRFQRGQPFWSLWSTGIYTFSEYKVLWKEMSGRRFAAAYIGNYSDPRLGEKVVIPDHKLYFVPVETENEAAYLTAILNSSIVSEAISAYAAQLSLGISVVEYLELPAFDPANPTHQRLAQLAKDVTANGGEPTDDEMREMDLLAAQVFALGE